MEKREVRQLRIGDRVSLKYSLGIGKITRIVWSYREYRYGNLPKDGMYPMIEFRDIMTKGNVGRHTLLLRSGRT